MAEPVLLYGVGATKAGTSWLYSYLEGHPDTHIRAVKELHFWDFDGRLPRGFARSQLENRLSGMQNRLKDARKAGRVADANRIKFNQMAVQEAIALHNDPSVDSYLDYLMSGAEDSRMVADFTPAYALADKDTLSVMQDIPCETRFVYMMRDPVARLWSHLRMQAGFAGAKGDEAVEMVGVLFERWLTGNEEGVTRRGDYAGALQRLNETVPEENLFLGFYEELFNQDGADKICQFLGLKSHKGNFDKRVWASMPVDMTDDQFMQAREALLPQYEAVEAQLGRLPEAWTDTLEMAA